MHVLRPCLLCQVTDVWRQRIGTRQSKIRELGRYCCVITPCGMLFHMGDKSEQFADAQTIDQQRIPVIDLKSVLATSSSSVRVDAYQEVGAAIHAAAQEVGFFYVTGHGIDQSIVDAALSNMRHFFNLDEHQKSTVTVDQTQKGWMPSGMANLEGAKTHDLKEVFFYGRELDANDPDLTARLPMVSRNQWPNAVCPALKEPIMEYHSALCTVGETILSAIAVGFNLSPKFFETYYDRPLARGQLVYYPPSTELDEQAQRYGVAPHTDFGVLTLLYQDTSGGLQVKSKVDGWIEAPPNYGWSHSIDRASERGRGWHGRHRNRGK